MRYRFPGRKLVDTLVDLPFAMPTAVAGIALYAGNGWSVERVLNFGASTRGELSGIVAAPGEAEPRHYEVEVGRQELAALALEAGPVVRLVPSRLAVFERPAVVAA